jgi:tetratricopeptide (TPR) repeat protein
MPGNIRTIGRDPVGRIFVELTNDGLVCTKELGARVATQSYYARAVALARAFGRWAVPPKGMEDPTRLVFEYDVSWEPLPIWLERRRPQSSFPLAEAVRIAGGICNALQQCVTDGQDEPEVNAASVIVSESRDPYCRLLLWARDLDTKPADYLGCTPETLVCAPPEDFCALPLTDRRTYAAAAILKLLFLSAPRLGEARNIIEWLVLDGNIAALELPASVPAGLGNAVREEWEQLSTLVRIATARHARARAVGLDQLAEACQMLLNRLDYWDLVSELCAARRYSDARDVCIYAIETKSHDDLWRPAFKRQLGSIYLNHLHDYEHAAEIFEEYISSERAFDRGNLAAVYEERGDALTGLSHLSKALEAYSRAAEFSPLDLALLLKIARTQRQLGDLGGALATLQRAAASHRTDVQALKLSAEICLEAGNSSGAQAYAAQALARTREQMDDRPLTGAMRRDIADAQALAATALFEQGQFESALALAGEALRNDSQCYRALNVFGRHYAHLGQVASAMRSFVASLRISADQPQIELWLEQALSEHYDTDPNGPSGHQGIT